MLIAHVERYLSLRQMLGYKLRNTSGNLRAFARFAAGRGDTHVRISTAMDWATEGTSPYTRHIRLRDAAQLARFLHAEDPTHEVPSNPFRAPKWRPLPYIYTPEEIVQLVRATSRLRESYPLRRQVYATMLGLIAATGLRISEALDLRLHDVLPEGVLQIRRTKFGKSRLRCCTSVSRQACASRNWSGSCWRTSPYNQRRAFAFSARGARNGAFRSGRKLLPTSAPGW